MAFDGITVANLTHDLKQAIEGGRIAKIAQPEKDELLFQIKKDGSSVRLVGFSQRQSSFGISDRCEQTQPHDCP